ncbi:hypothetical protein OG785_32305 [Streptomyces sp. NBC_00006]|uniref:hypothetical protein n=1 Tax=Streptomyces sp. NBC_00006 TaxID=2975619 RepID=UPI00225B48CA|nr:hypothetical protein [Streptomyces sp. NBC_00006]MCX5535222.1 hypothetical protein [Streptomyces sp. NBC_00006]
MADAQETNERRLRRLRQMQRNGSVTNAAESLDGIWKAGKEPDSIVLRSTLLLADGERSRLTKLVLPRGIALRFYLLAVFEAQCRLEVGAPWHDVLPMKGPGSWSALVAVDGAYDTALGTYDSVLDDMPADLRGSTQAEERWGKRKLEDQRLQQVKGALRTLEDLGQENALVTMKRVARGQRSYESFLLMQESGRGETQTPDLYTVPAPRWAATKTITLPKDFFLKGWIQVLNPSEVATWLILRMMSQWAPTKHHTSGVFLTTRPRVQLFGLRDDAWEDGCRRLLEFGLIRHAEPPETEDTAEGADTDPAMKMLFSQPERARRPYEPHRWQVTDGGLAKDAAKKLDRELTHRQKALDTAAMERAQHNAERLAGHPSADR